MPSTPAPPKRTRRDFARLLWDLADLVQAADRRRSFRARAFRSAVWSLDHLSVDLRESPEEMAAVGGIGPGIIRLLDEFLGNGTLAEFERLRIRFPADVARISRLPRITPGRLEALKQGLGVETVADLLAAIDAGALTTLEGIGPATVDRWSRILSLPPSPGAVPAHQAAVAAGRLRGHLADHLTGDDVYEAGQVRRLEEWVTEVDLVIVTDDPERAAHFLENTATVGSSAMEPGWAVDLITHDRIPVAVHMTEPAEAGSALVRWTGPTAHVASLGVEGTNPQTTEEGVYETAGRVWIPPPARSADVENASEVVRRDDVVGDLHVHSDWSPDGHMDFDEIAELARKNSYQYVAITDHTFGLRFAGLDPEGLARQRRAVADVRRRHPDLAILHGAEINIDREGRPDLDDETLSRLDIVVAGCHSDFDLPRREQTARLVNAVRHPAIKILAHPTGRRIGIRPGFDVDLETVYAAAAEAHTALEINGHRDRMDLSDDNAARASAAGVGLIVDSDSHRPLEFANMGVAVGVAQRAGLGRDRILNTLDHDRFMAWVESRTGNA